MMLTWAFSKGAYQQLTIVLLIGIFYLIPKKRQKDKTIVIQDSNPTSGVTQ
jgi:hypothetical protein